MISIKFECQHNNLKIGDYFREKLLITSSSIEYTKKYRMPCLKLYKDKKYNKNTNYSYKINCDIDESLINELKEFLMDSLDFHAPYFEGPELVYFVKFDRKEYEQHIVLLNNTEWVEKLKDYLVPLIPDELNVPHFLQ